MIDAIPLQSFIDFVRKITNISDKNIINQNTLLFCPKNCLSFGQNSGEEL